MASGANHKKNWARSWTLRAYVTRVWHVVLCQQYANQEAPLAGLLVATRLRGATKAIKKETSNAYLLTATRIHIEKRRQTTQKVHGELRPLRQEVLIHRRPDFSSNHS